MSKAPAIITPERIIESNSQAGIQGYFEVELIHKPTGLVKFKSRFKNLITNAGLEYIGNGTGAVGARFMFATFPSYGFMGVGTGTTTPAVTDTTLVSQVVRTDSRGSPQIAGSAGVGPDSDYWFQRVTKVFLPGVGTGNLTEVGLFDQSSGGTMFARQLFRDNDGNPTTIVKTADDELRVTYDFRIYTMKTSNTSTLTVKGISTTFTTRGYRINQTNRWGDTSFGGQGLNWTLGNGWSTSTGNDQYIYSSSVMPDLNSAQVTTGQTAPSSVSWGAYTGASLYRDQTMIWNPGVGALTIGSIVWGGAVASAPFITTIEPAIAKTASERFTFVGRFSFGRV